MKRRALLRNALLSIGGDKWWGCRWLWQKTVTLVGIVTGTSESPDGTVLGPGIRFPYDVKVYSIDAQCETGPDDAAASLVVQDNGVDVAQTATDILATGETDGHYEIGEQDHDIRHAPLIKAGHTLTLAVSTSATTGPIGLKAAVTVQPL